MVLLELGARYKAVVHIAKKQLGLRDEEYRELLQSSAGIVSAKDMRTVAQFQLIMDAFEKLGYKGRREKERGGGDGQWGCTVRQRVMIEQLWRERARNTGKQALCAFIERTAHVSDPRFLTKEMASKVIVAIGRL